MNKKWSITEENYIREHAGTYTDAQLAQKLSEMKQQNVTMLAVRKKRQKMGIKKAQGRGYCKLQDHDQFYKDLT